MPRRGRFQGRGRGHTRRHLRCKSSHDSSHTASNIADSKNNEEQALSLKTDLQTFFIGNASFDCHFRAQQEDCACYYAGLCLLRDNGVEISANARVRSLAAAWARNDHKFAELLLSDQDRFGLVEVVKAVTLLDSGRQIRVLEKKLKYLEVSGAKITAQKLSSLKSEIKNLSAMKPKFGSASGSTCKQIRKWVQRFTREELEFFALHLPKEPWKKLADICHFNPSMDFPTLPWFLPFCFGEPAPTLSIVHHCQNVTVDNVNQLISEFNIPYTHLKGCKSSLTSNSKARIATYEPKLDTVIWYYEDLMCEETDKVILQRLENGEPILLPVGKLIERLMTFRLLERELSKNGEKYKVPFLDQMVKLGETKLKKLNLSLEHPVVVIGDASGSMTVAINTSTIIAGLLCSMTSAKLVFFNSKNMEAAFLPRSIEQVIKLASETNATGSTSPAASLYPFYENKEVVKTFIIATDEEENTCYNNYFFSPLFKKYHQEVYPARLVFVSFLSRQSSKGQMVSALKSEGFSALQFCFNLHRPDLTKLDSLFGRLYCESASFSKDLTQKTNEINSQGILAPEDHRHCRAISTSDLEWASGEQKEANKK